MEKMRYKTSPKCVESAKNLIKENRIKRFCRILEILGWELLSSEENEAYLENDGFSIKIVPDEKHDFFIIVYDGAGQILAFVNIVIMTVVRGSNGNEMLVDNFFKNVFRKN